MSAFSAPEKVNSIVMPPPCVGVHKFPAGLPSGVAAQAGLTGRPNGL